MSEVPDASMALQLTFRSGTTVAVLLALLVLVNFAPEIIWWVRRTFHRHRRKDSEKSDSSKK